MNRRPFALVLLVAVLAAILLIGALRWREQLRRARTTAPSAPAEPASAPP